MIAALSRAALVASAIAFAPQADAAGADGYPKPREGSFTVRDFRFHTGETLPELKLGYVTIGEPGGEPVVILHGTGGSAQSMLTPAFAGELFGAGGPLDATKYFIVIPDAVGHGKSTKPSDGLKAKFPRYNYDDMVRAQHLVVTQALGLKRVRLVLGNSMGGMNVWMWGQAYPDLMDALVPMASQPSAMASRNWLMRRMIVDAIRTDPAWKGGEYTEQPQAFRTANVFFGIATNGGSLAYQQQAPTREAADKLLAARMGQAYKGDANDFLYQWDSSRDYDASAGLEKIGAHVLAINSADDERNPPESGIMEREMKRLKHGRLLLIPASSDTRGHGTTGLAKFWKEDLRRFLDTVPRRGS